MNQLISNDNIQRLDEITQEAGRWEVSNQSRSFTVTLLRYFREDGKVEYGGYFKCTSLKAPESDACGDFYPNESDALNDLLCRVAEFTPRNPSS